MPFKIVRDDITRVRADAIVNTANPEPKYESGTDTAIYKAAGEDLLLTERKKIGEIMPGETVVTPAFNLHAKYIIHTVGPAWIDGNHGEFDILRSCYRKSLLLADQLKCKSIAFPLIATGVYGFPKDKALETALSVIREHLEDSDINVILVVFERNAYQLASGLTKKVEEYIDENYVTSKLDEEYDYASDSASAPRRRRRFFEKKNPQAYFNRREANPPVGGSVPSANAPIGGSVPSESAPQAAPNAVSGALFESTYENRPEPKNASVFHKPSKSESSGKKKKSSLDDAVNHLGENFQTRLFRMIDERGLSDPDVYKKANIDRKLFSKIRCNEGYTPKKNTIVALAIAMKLNLDDTKDLLASAGYALSPSNKTDVILSFCIENGIYDIYEVESILFDYTGTSLMKTA